MSREELINELANEGYSEKDINKILDIQSNTFADYKWTLDTLNYIKDKSFSSTEKRVNMLGVLLEYYLYSVTH
jgi:DNA-directed RNA polymerase subunit F